MVRCLLCTLLCFAGHRTTKISLHALASLPNHAGASRVARHESTERRLLIGIASAHVQQGPKERKRQIDMSSSGDALQAIDAKLLKVLLQRCPSFLLSEILARFTEPSAVPR